MQQLNSPGTPDILGGMVSRLRDRARNLRTQSWAILGMILGAVGLGVALFIQADSIAGTYSASGLETELRKTAEWVRSASSNLGPHMLRAGEQPPPFEESLKETESLLAAARGSLDVMKDSLAELTAAEKENRSPELRLASGIATRVSTVLLLIFLVQILVVTYRYTVRASAFYEARADALELAGHFNSEEFERITRVLAPDTLDFGKSPVSPAQHAVELAKEILSKSPR